MLGRRDFIYQCGASVLFFLSSCVYRKAERPLVNPLPETPPRPSPIVHKTTFLTDLSGKTMIGGDIIEIVFEKAEGASYDLEFSRDGGSSWSKVSIGINTHSFRWEVPQMESITCLLRLKNDWEAIESGTFRIIASFAIHLQEHPELSNPDGFKEFLQAAPGPLIAMRKGESFVILSLTCTHNGCATRWDAGLIRCPCHGSIFGKDGSVIEGPAKAPLLSLKHKISSDGNKILIYS